MAEKTPAARLIRLASIVCALCASLEARGATLSVTSALIPQGTDVDLTAEGPLDWVHWGLYTDSSIDRKAGVTPQIPDFTPKGFTGPFPYADNFNGYSWRDGSPTSSMNNTPTGVWMYGKPNGFELQFPADTTPKTLKIYVGTFAAVGEFTATLSGAPKYTDTSITNLGNGPGGVYTLDVTADTPGEVLDIKFIVDRTFDPTGNGTLQAAALCAPHGERQHHHYGRRCGRGREYRQREILSRRYQAGRIDQPSLQPDLEQRAGRQLPVNSNSLRRPRRGANLGADTNFCQRHWRRAVCSWGIADQWCYRPLPD